MQDVKYKTKNYCVEFLAFGVLVWCATVWTIWGKTATFNTIHVLGK